MLVSILDNPLAIPVEAHYCGLYGLSGLLLEIVHKDLMRTSTRGPR